MSFLLVALGGFIGSVLRFYVSTKTNRRLIGTWIANITGSIFFVFIFHFYSTDMISKIIWIFLGVGFCGAYTTFSTFGNETLQLILEKKYGKAIVYVLVSVLTSLLLIVNLLNILD